jgi:hypothetical protein
MKTEPDQPAFPLERGMDHETATGMTLRQYYAGQAMQGLLSNPEMVGPRWLDDIGETALKVADLTIAALNEPSTEI